MPQFDLHTKIKVSRGISPIAAVTNNTAFTSEIIDTAGALATEFVWCAGSIADTDCTFTLLVEHDDDAALGSAAAVADSALLGTEAGAKPLFGSDNKCGKIGYIGTKRYVRVTITPADNTGNIFLAGVWVQRMDSLQTTQIV